jgi:adenylate cyclase
MGIVEVADDTVAFGTDDLSMARSLRVVMTQEGGREEHIFRLARLLGGSFARITEAQASVLDDVLSNLVEEGGLETPAQRAAVLSSPEAHALLKVFEQSMGYVWRRHMFATLGRWVGADDDQQTMAVGFADISGFSAMSKRTDDAELALVIERFESEAVDVVSHNGGRVVKFIGDEAFFVVDGIETAVEVALELGERMLEGDEPVTLHCGLAAGPTVTIGGDVFGTTVNLAKRLTDIARRGKVVLPREQAAELAERDDLVLHRVPRVFELKGVGRTPIVSVTRRQPKPDA